ncbi:MAG: tRNA lysidine(34) synthetase TilS [Phycisphaerae bacterium]|nr:tRNA lysidine(34) synthetase TilS [Phycisphaerales bacterium]
MNSPDFLERLRSRIQRDGLLTPGAKVIVGVSGGADSTALLHALHQVSRDENTGYRLHVAHLNHQLRGAESDDDAAFVSALADSLQLPCTIETCDLRAESESQRSSLEDIARRARLRFFDDMCKSTGANHVALAHHADDQVETVLHRFMRGTGVRGLSGMSAKRPLSKSSRIQIIRPLLEFSRQEILEFIESAGLSYRHDSSNTSRDHTRNRIRHDLLPQLEASFNPQVREAILRLAQQSRWTNEYLRDTSQSELKRAILEQTPSSVALDRKHVARLPMIIQTGVLRLAFESIGMRERRLTFRHVADLAEAVASPDARNRFSLPDGVDVRFDRNRITLSRGAKNSKDTRTAVQSESIS